MKYAGIIKNDFSAAPGPCVSFFVQGCPHKCAGCHNPETWDFGGGKEFTLDVLQELLTALSANGIQRTLCVMGGEPLCKENLFLTQFVISFIKEKSPETKIYVWTGYTLEELLQSVHNKKIIATLNLCDYLIDGKYDSTKRDITLPMRGSSNQKIYNLKETLIDLS